MGLRRWFNGTFRPDTLDTESLKVGGNSLLSDGDVLPLLGFNSPEDRVIQFTDTTWAGRSNHLEARVQWDILTPHTDRIEVALTGDLRAGTDETPEIRLYNGSDGEEILRHTNATGANESFVEGWTPYTPPSPSADTAIRVEVQTDNGTNTCESHTPNFMIGLRL